MEASIGVMSEIESVASVASWIPRIPTPTPTSAAMIGKPAATSEPKVTSRTIAATAIPISSAVPSISVAPENALPLYFTVRSVSSYLSRTSVTAPRASEGTSRMES